MLQWVFSCVPWASGALGKANFTTDPIQVQSRSPSFVSFRPRSCPAKSHHWPGATSKLRTAKACSHHRVEAVSWSRLNKCHRSPVSLAPQHQKCFCHWIHFSQALLKGLTRFRSLLWQQAAKQKSGEMSTLCLLARMHLVLRHRSHSWDRSLKPTFPETKQQLASD